MDKPRLDTLYEQIGEEKIHQLVEAFYPKVYEDSTLRPLFQEEMSEMMRKQRMFLTQFLGGPTLYSDEFGPPAMRRRHLPFEITPKRAEGWLRCMRKAFQEVGLDQHPAGEVFYNRLQQVAGIMVNTMEE